MENKFRIGQKLYFVGINQKIADCEIIAIKNDYLVTDLDDDDNFDAVKTYFVDLKPNIQNAEYYTTKEGVIKLMEFNLIRWKQKGLEYERYLFNLKNGEVLD